LTSPIIEIFFPKKNFHIINAVPRGQKSHQYLRVEYIFFELCDVVFLVSGSAYALRVNAQEAPHLPTLCQQTPCWSIRFSDCGAVFLWFFGGRPGRKRM